MMKLVRGQSQAPLDPLLGRTVAVLGFGNQGQAHASNLRDSGISVIVATRPDSPTRAAAQDQGFQTMSTVQAVQQSDLVIMALPDELHADVFEREVRPSLKPNAVIGFLHGFSIRYNLVQPPDDIGVVMIAPKGPGRTLRQRYLMGQGIPCLFAMHQDSPRGDAEAIALAWATGIGCSRAGVLYTSFEAETDTDLFGEQAVLCGGVTQLILDAFQALVDAGYPPELAYLECCHEVKQVADLVYERGLTGMMQAISNTAEFGAYRAGPMLIDESVRQRMRTLLGQIQDGSFARALMQDRQHGFQWFHSQRESLKRHPIEAAGQTIRSLMPWLGEAQ